MNSTQTSPVGHPKYPKMSFFFQKGLQSKITRMGFLKIHLKASIYGPVLWVCIWCMLADLPSQPMIIFPTWAARFIVCDALKSQHDGDVIGSACWNLGSLENARIFRLHVSLVIKIIQTDPEKNDLRKIMI